MKKIIIFIILMGLGIGWVVSAQPVQLPPEEVHIRATIPSGVVDFPPPVITTLPGASEGTPIIQIINLRDTSCEIVWGTIENSNSIVEYGETSDYGTTVVDWELVKSHKIKLTDLKEKTTYHFRVKSRTNVGKESVSLEYIFKTLDLTPPANASNFSAKPGDRTITLSWTNPSDNDLAGVKIQISTKMYPGGPDEGTTVYDGKDETFAVSNLQNGVRYYFTAFSYDDSKNYASGAITSAVPTAEAMPGVPGIYIPSELVPKISELKLEDFLFFIKGVQIFPEDGVIRVKPGEQFKISIPQEKLPKVLKTILIIIGIAEQKEGTLLPSTQPGNVVFAAEIEQLISSYLLRINTEETAYEAIVTAPGVPDNYPLTIVIMDFKEGTVAKIEATLKVLAPEGALTAKIQKESEEKINWIPLIILIVIILIIGASIGYLVGRLRKKSLV